MKRGEMRKNIYRIRGDVVDIFMANGYTAVIDLEDLEKVLQYRWRVLKDRNTVYAIAHTPMVNSKQKTIRMHRVVMGATDPKLQIDHRDHDGLNNCKSNLRACSHSQNLMNQVVKGGTSKYKGVHWHKQHKKWRSRI